VPVRPSPAAGDAQATRGIVSKAVKAVVVKIADRVVDEAVGFVLGRLARAFETTAWKQKGLREGWLKATRDSLAAGKLQARTPSSTDRSLLLIHGTFSNAASAYKSLSQSTFFEDVAPLYGDRIFAFDHFTVSRTPAENVEMLLKALPDKTFTFDVITHSRGGLVLRNLVERAATFGMSSRFNLGRAVLVAAPNEGTPLATPGRWEDTVGWVANLLELFPDNPFTTGAEFVANGLVWIAKHASGDLPGIHSMDGDGELIRDLQAPPGPPSDRYSVLVSNYNPPSGMIQRLLDIGIDQFFNTANDLVVPSEGGWRVDPSGGTFIPGSRIGCFGPGGNISRNDVTHVNFFAQPETVPFLVAALNDQPQKLAVIDPAERLPDRRLIRSGAPGIAAPAAAVAPGGVAGLQRARLRGPEPTPPAAPDAASRLEITVVNGDLSFEEKALLIGHYRSTVLTGTERVIDRLLQRAMGNALDLGVYPDQPGSYRIFPNRQVATGQLWQTPRPESVIVAGLGPEGKLRSADIVHTVRQAVLAWVERVAEDRRSVKRVSMATTLLASGGTGITPGQSAQLIAQGVHDANELIRRSGGQRLPLVRELRVIELYLSRATEAWEALKMLAHATPTRYHVAEPIVAGRGSLRRPLVSGYRGADYDFITAQTRQDEKGVSWIQFALDTKRARTEVRAQATQARLLRDLVATASSGATSNPQIGKTLYNLLVPIELEAFLASSGETQIEVDKGTAGIPWELLDDSSPAQSQRAPWAIRSKLLRKFRTENFRSQVSDASLSSSVLVIGEPQCPPDYPPLPGALEEARQVYGLLTSPNGLAAASCKSLFAETQAQAGPDARAVVDALFERSWRIVHVAGHGEPVSEKGDRGGVVLSNDTFLGAAEIKAMRVVPELVFVNCCHLAAGSRRSVLSEPRHGKFDRAEFASSVAHALIEIGVRCVVAAGWAVDDAAATAFATTFYSALLGGQRFIDAVGVARAETHKYDGNTWAAYQCYGDPDWTFVKPEDWKPGAKQARPDEFDDIGSINALKLALDTLVVESEFQGADAAYQCDRLQNLERRWQSMAWPASSEVAERFAAAYAAAGDLANAIRWYETAMAEAEGHISFRMLEQVSNLRIRQALALLGDARAEETKLTAAKVGRGRGRAQMTEARRRVRSATDAARSTIADEMKKLGQLTTFQATAERESLRGSAMKRLAMLEAGAGRRGAERRAIAAMASHYGKALALARKRGSPELYYPAVNVIASTLALHGATTRLKGLKPALFEEARASVKAKNAADPDFWSLIAVPELLVYEAVARGSLAKRSNGIHKAFHDVGRRSRDRTKWRSVLDTMRFVLDPYVARASGRNQRAARELLEMIEGIPKPQPEES
jgi:CHAT domain-containing protein